jgi:hypothetical protein
MAMKTGNIRKTKGGKGRCHSVKLKAAKINGSRMPHPMKNPVETNLTKLPKLIPVFVILIFIFLPKVTLQFRFGRHVQNVNAKG